MFMNNMPTIVLGYLWSFIRFLDQFHCITIQNNFKDFLKFLFVMTSYGLSSSVSLQPRFIVVASASCKIKTWYSFGTLFKKIASWLLVRRNFWIRYIVLSNITVWWILLTETILKIKQLAMRLGSFDSYSKTFLSDFCIQIAVNYIHLSGVW